MKTITNPQLDLAFDFVQYTNKNVFLTGKAGTGKTTFLHNLKKNAIKRMIVVAPTGVAAINAGGVTIHSFFQMSFGPHIPVDTGNNSDPLEKRNFQSGKYKFNHEKIAIIKSLDLLVIDEISMVRADLLDGVDEVLRKYKDRHKPFGGVQLLMIGDLHQLAPIVKEEESKILKQYYDTFFFFGSRALQKTQYISIELKHIYRQNDEHFISLLGKVRENSLDIDAFEELNKRYLPEIAKAAGDGYITLTTHNYQAKSINESKLEKLKEKVYFFDAQIEGEFPAYSYPVEPQLILKKGAQVMFVKNDSSRDKLYYNGKIGKVMEFDAESVIVKCDEDESPIYCHVEKWENIRYEIDDQTKEIKETAIGIFLQYPLKLAWAITIHKSQGLTFDKAIVDANAAFAPGQVYVAFSRCRTLNGLILSSPVSRNCIKTDSTINTFTTDIQRNYPGQEMLSQAKFEFQKILLSELFDFKIITRQLYSLLKVLKENAGSIGFNIPGLFENIIKSMKEDLSDVSEKFTLQLQFLTRQSANIETNGALQDRIMKACIYFYAKTETILTKSLSGIEIESDNKTLRRALNSAITHLNEEVFIKKECLKECQNGFIAGRYLNVRAKASINDKELKMAQPKSVNQDDGSITQGALYSRLKSWRNNKADEKNLPVYMILQLKPLMDISRYLPSTLNDLNEIKGLGKKKVQIYGNEILEIITDYCRENNIETRPEKPDHLQKTVSDTKKISFELYKSGKTTGQIAAERGLTVSTIEGHLAHFIGTGKINISELVSPEKIDMITNYFTHTGNYNLAPAKKILGEIASYSELQLVLSHLQFERKIKLK